MYYLIGYLIISLASGLFFCWTEDRIGRYDSKDWTFLIGAVLLWPITLTLLLGMGLIEFAKYLSRRGTTDRARMKARFRRKREEYRIRKLEEEKVRLRGEINSGRFR